jgi:release factor glutamine methyltransferase
MEGYPEILECDGVYPPREDSFLLFDAIEVREGDRFLDIGTGTGIIGIGAAMNGAEVYATDISEKALLCARENAERNSVEIEFIRSDILTALNGKFDVIAFNPPYLPESGIDYDVKHAVESPGNGSFHISRFFSKAPELLRDGGRAYFLISSHTDIPAYKLENYRKIAEKALFFERLYVFMLLHKKDL